ncbi:MAG: hypothetical protein C3F11_07605 [Methylocystaceae bacterium]|nr:MAG: hypothetical protein C3F11_07605 [Methylocystaceae bacterium]
MTCFIVHYGVWLSLAFVVGLLTALICLEKDTGGLLRRTDFVPTLCILLFVAFTQVTLGKIALYAESAVLVLLAFLAGVGLIVAFLGRISRDHVGWKLGASSIALIWLAANVSVARDVEAELKHRLGSLVERAGGDSFNFEVSGRDVFLPADGTDQAALAERLRRAAGVRIVWRVDALSPQAAELRSRAIAAAAAARAARRAAEADWARRQTADVATAAAERSGAKQKESQPGAKQKSAKDAIAEGRSATPRPAAGTGETPVALPPIVWKPPMDPTLAEASHPDAGETSAALATTGAAKSPAPVCRTALSAIAASEKIRFAVASASLRIGPEPVLDKLAELLKLCPDATLEIGGHTDSQGRDDENRSLSLRRAQAVVDYLGRLGVERARLLGVGYGAERPVAAGDTPKSRAENRRVEFAVK